MEKFTVRKAGVAGFFYPGDAIALEREISLLLEAAPEVEFERPVRAIVAPHAGYMYSGGVAARAYRQIMRKNYQRVVVIAPSHREAFGKVSLFNGKAFQTPLGEISVDNELVEKLADGNSQLMISSLGHAPEEHALEVHLPFLQWALGKFKLIPISMGDQSWENIQKLSEVLSLCLPDAGTLIVGSSDLSHFYRDEEARRLDAVAQQSIENFDEDQLWNDITGRLTEMCGYGPVITAMKVARKMGAAASKIMSYRNSGDITGDRTQVVGYLSAVFY